MRYLDKVKSSHTTLVDVSVYTQIKFSYSAHLCLTLNLLSHGFMRNIIFIHVLQIEASKEDVTVTFLELIQTLLKDPEERQDFFTVRQHNLQPVKPNAPNCVICSDSKFHMKQISVVIIVIKLQYTMFFIVYCN